MVVPHEQVTCVMDLRTAKPGELVAFQIACSDGFTSSNVGKWGVLKVLGHDGAGHAIVSVLEGLYVACPTVEDVAEAPLLFEERFEPKDTPTILEIDPGFDGHLPSATGIGRQDGFRPEETEYLSGVQTGGGRRRLVGVHFPAFVLDHENRAKHDREAWLAEIEAMREQAAARAAAIEKRQKERLNGLTLAHLQAEILLSDWDERAEFLPAAFVEDVRMHAQCLLADLAALGEKPRRPTCRNLLRRFVEQLNTLDTQAGHVIETDEREELWQLVEEICWAIKQRPLLEEVDAWRDW